MRRVVGAVCICASSFAHADDRIEQPLIPDLSVLEPIYHLDRYEEREDRSLEGAHASAGIGVGTDGVETLVGGALGWRDREHVLATMRGELATTNLDILRGHYLGVAGAQDEKLGAAL